MIVLPTTAQRIARLPLLIRAHDCLDETGAFGLSYGQRVPFVFTRTGHAGLEDQRGVAARAAGGAVRVMPVLDNRGSRAPAIVLEEAGANLCGHPEQLGTAPWNAAGALTVTPAYAVAAGMSFNRVVNPAGGVLTYPITFTGDGVKSFRLAVRTDGVAGLAHALLWDATATTSRGGVAVTIASNGSVSAAATGAAVILQKVPAADGVLRLLVQVPGVVAANTNVFYASDSGSTTVASFQVTGVQVEDRPTPTTYMYGAGGSVSRAAETCYLSYLKAVAALQVFVAGVELGTNLGSTDTALFSLGGGGNPSLFVDGGAATYSLFHRRSGDDSSSVAGTTAFGDEVWLRGQIAGTGAVTLGQSVNRGTEEVAAPSPASGLAAAWDVPRFYLGSRSSVRGHFGFRAVCVAPPGLSRDALADFCEVG